MATWHQRHAGPVQLWHATLYTVETGTRYGYMSALTLFQTADAAREYYAHVKDRPEGACLIAPASDPYAFRTSLETR